MTEHATQDEHEAGRPADPLAESASTGNQVTEGDQVATGDIVIDAALRDLAAVDATDLDGHIEAAESLQRTLQGRLANLGE